MLTKEDLYNQLDLRDYDIKKLEHKLKVSERAFEMMFAVVDCPVAEAGKCKKPDKFNCIEYYKHLAEKELEG